MPVLLSAKFRHLRCLRTLGGASNEIDREQSLYEILPASARI